MSSEWGTGWTRPPALFRGDPQQGPRTSRHRWAGRGPYVLSFGAPPPHLCAHLFQFSPSLFHPSRPENQLWGGLR